MTVARLAAEKAVKRTGQIMHDYIILTTESSDILHAHRDYSLNATWPFNFIVNEADIGQNLGHPSSFGERANDIMLSTMMALKMQLMPETSIGNCCSGFHKLMGEFLSRGCGAAKNESF